MPFDDNKVKLLAQTAVLSPDYPSRKQRVCANDCAKISSRHLARKRVLAQYLRACARTVCALSQSIYIVQFHIRLEEFVKLSVGATSVTEQQKKARG